MKHPWINRVAASIIFLLAVSLSMPGAQELIASDGSIGRRVALVIGNSAYAQNPLPNPVNDAKGIRDALSACGFEVFFAVDAKRDEMLRQIDAFTKRLKGASAGLFFFAGHGSQVAEKNYLIPVGEPIDDEASLAALSIPLDLVLGKMTASGSDTVLVFLDACRNNPYQASSRSGTRGLSKPDPIGTKNSLIAFATDPGREALDGIGANSPFSGALIRELQKPGLEINDIMRNVTRAVAAETMEKQRPWIQASMREPFYFLDSDAAYKKVLAERDKVAGELEALQARSAKLTEDLAKAKSADEKEKIAREQQKLKAEQALKLQEAESVKAEAVRFEAERERLAKERALADARRIEENANLARMRALAEEQKAALAKLESASQDLGSYYRRYAEFTRVRKSIQAGALSAWEGEMADFDKYWNLRYEAVDSLKKEPWETAQEFESRKASFKGGLDAEKRKDLETKKKAHETRAAELTRDIDQATAALKAELEARIFTIKGEDIKIGYQPFDAAQKSWAVDVQVLRPSMLFSRQYRHSIAGSPDMGAAFSAVDSAIRADSLLGELDFKVRIEGNGDFSILVQEFRVLDLARGGKVVFADKSQGAVYAYKPVALVRFEDSGITLTDRAGKALPTFKRVEGEYFLIDTGSDPIVLLSTGTEIRLTLPVDARYTARIVPKFPLLPLYTLDDFPGKMPLPEKPQLLEEFKSVKRIGDRAVPILIGGVVGGLAEGLLGVISGDFKTMGGLILLSGLSLGLYISLQMTIQCPDLPFIRETPVPLHSAIKANNKTLAEWQPKYDAVMNENKLLLEKANLEIEKKNEEIRRQNESLGYLILRPISSVGEEIKISYMERF
ncbi:MAG TPA: caspase family protein [Rectinemataceae bacterium]